MKTNYFILGFFLFSTFLSATIINIPADQLTIQAGIDVAVDADTVLVQPGTYVENINYNGKNITVASLFLTTQDTTYISQTIIDGDSLDTVVIFENGEDSNAVLSGFTLVNGCALYGGGIRCDNSNPSLQNLTITDNPFGCFGGGIYCSFSSPNLENVSIKNNFSGSGGGIFCDNSSPSLVNVTIRNNFTAYGGGIYFYDNSNPILMNVTITDNCAEVFGGGICCFNSSPSLMDVTITGNNAWDDGGGFYCSFNSSPSIDSVIISGNNADNDGGGVYIGSGNPSLVNVNIVGNSAANGGGIYCHGSNPSLENVTISENSAENGGGGGFYCDSSSPSLEDVIIIDNTAYYAGGIRFGDSSPSLVAVTITGNSATLYGGGMSCGIESDPVLENVTITGNSADYAGGIHCYYNSNPSLMNSILWNDSPQEIYFEENGDPCTITISYSDIQGGEAGIVTNINGTVNWLEGNIDEDPLFVDPLVCDFHLTGNSPCIDAGDPNFPLDPDNTICDMGAFYYHQDQYIVVDEIYPEPGSHTISEGDSINFYITASDPDGNPIEYSWVLDSELVSTDSSYTFHTDENSVGTYTVTLEVTDNYQPPFRNTLNFEWDIIVEDVSSAQEFLHTETAIYQNIPNPFNPSTTINYSLKENSKVSLNIYNIKGQKVKQLVRDQLSTGQHSVIWNGKDDNGKSVSSGIYFYKLKTDNYEKTKRMLLMK